MFKFDFGEECQITPDISPPSTVIPAQFQSFPPLAVQPSTAVLTLNHGVQVRYVIKPQSDLHKKYGIQHDTDVVCGVYEGGLKLWECAIDLSQHLLELLHSGDSLDGKKVLEIGCGHGIPGIIAMLNGADVTFQDLNAEVLDSTTHANVTANIPSHRHTQCRYISGDWGSIASMLSSEAGTFDLILTADTLYNVSSYPRLHELISSLLKPSGQALLATKRYYFGVGGGTNSFVDYNSRQASAMHIDVVASFEDGKSNIRDILRARPTQT